MRFPSGHSSPTRAASARLIVCCGLQRYSTKDSLVECSPKRRYRKQAARHCRKPDFVGTRFGGAHTLRRELLNFPWVSSVCLHMRLLLLAFVLLCTSPADAQTSFDVATVRLSSGEVKFEHDGEMTLSHGTLRMHDVTLLTCVKWAYHVQRAQIDGLDGMDHQHYDIVAKADGEPTIDQVRIMLRELLTERFALKLHPRTKEVNAYVLTIAPHGLKKLKPAAMIDGEPWHQNSAMGMVAKSFTMQDFCDVHVRSARGTAC